VRLRGQLDHVSTWDLNQNGPELRDANAESTSLSALPLIAAISPMRDLRFAAVLALMLWRVISSAGGKAPHV
jgi:hypothetical protein